MTKRRQGVRSTKEMGCPSPGKRGYPTEEGVRKNIQREPERYGHEIYLCKCGMYHLTTNSNSKKRRNKIIRDALNKGTGNHGT